MALDVDSEIVDVLVQEHHHPRLRRPTPRRWDGNLNLLDAQYVEAVHSANFWESYPPLRSWRLRLSWRFRGANYDPGALQGGLAEEATVDKWFSFVRPLFRRPWINPQRTIPAPAWLDASLAYDPQFDGWYTIPTPPLHAMHAHRRSFRNPASRSSERNTLVLTEAQATTSAPLGGMNWTGGRRTLP